MANSQHSTRRLRPRLAAVAAVTVLAAAPARDGFASGAMRADEDNRVQALLVSAERDTRALAFGAGRRWMDAEGGRDRYQRVLWSAWQRQEASFARAVRDGASAVGLFANSYRNWQALGADAMSAVHSGLDASGQKLELLDRRFEQASQARRESDLRMGRAVAAVERISTVGNGLLEIERELAGLGARSRPASASVRALLASLPDGRVVLAAEKTLLAARGARDGHIEAALHNREQTWAPGSARSFASLLNTRRHALGLEPLRLEPRLWKACAMHVAEMKRLGYFDHVSPEPARRTPDRRAEIAEFDGSFQGENLYQSPRPEQPERVLRSWWASDSHRYVLFSPEPNTMGLDPGGGTHWALMTGRL